MVEQSRDAYFFRESFGIPEVSFCMAAESAFIFSTALRMLSAELDAEVSAFCSLLSGALLHAIKARKIMEIDSFFIRIV